ncbi:MAG: hypothetical protein AB1714_15800 [Acidobacteriota bacterium]
MPVTTPPVEALPAAPWASARTKTARRWAAGQRGRDSLQALLGIGVDSGLIAFRRSWDVELLAVGTPVVYACRMSSLAAPGQTLLNQQFYQKLQAETRRTRRIRGIRKKLKREGVFTFYGLSHAMTKRSRSGTT